MNAGDALNKTLWACSYVLSLKTQVKLSHKPEDEKNGMSALD